MDLRCLGCMQMFENKYRICPYCGYVVGAQPDEPGHIIPGTMLAGRFVVGKVMGFGGFGVTYIGWDERLQRKVAIKEYFPGELSTRAPGQATVTAYSGDKNQYYYTGLKKFLDEARILAKVSEMPGIVNVIDFFEENNTAYIIMEFVEGVTLKDYIANRQMSAEEIFSLMIPVMTTLKEIHRFGVIHRDISPDNIMINNSGIKLIDFGAARVVTNSFDQSFSIVLKHGYAPEEQYRTKGVQGPWTDIYALCATMYRCITGMVPESANDRLYNDTLKKPSALGIKIDKKTEYIIMKGLSVKQNDRYQNIDELLSDANSVSAPQINKPAKKKRKEPVTVTGAYDGGEMQNVNDDGEMQNGYDGGEMQNVNDDGEILSSFDDDEKKGKSGKKALIIILCAVLLIAGVVVAGILLRKGGHLGFLDKDSGYSDSDTKREQNNADDMEGEFEEEDEETTDEETTDEETTDEETTDEEKTTESEEAQREKGYKDGNKKGKKEGKAAGYDDGVSGRTARDALTDKVGNGTPYQEGYSSGYNAGYNAEYFKAYKTGYEEYISANEDDYYYGDYYDDYYQNGYYNGYNDSSGFEDGWNDGYNHAMEGYCDPSGAYRDADYSDSYDIGWCDGYAAAYYEGYDQGQSDAYNQMYS